MSQRSKRKIIMGLIVSQIGFIFYLIKVYYHLKLNYTSRNKPFSISVFLKDIFLLNNITLHEASPFYFSLKNLVILEQVNLARIVKVNSYLFLLFEIVGFLLAYYEY